MDGIRILLLFLLMHHFGLICEVGSQKPQTESQCTRVTGCPATGSDWKLKSSKSKCATNNTYHCIMTEENYLCEICIKPLFIYKDRPGCPTIGLVHGSWEFAKFAECPNTTVGCPDNKNSYNSDELYKFAACTRTSVQTTSIVQSTPTDQSETTPQKTSVDSRSSDHTFAIIGWVVAGIFVLIGVGIFIFKHRQKLCERADKANEDDIEIPDVASVKEALLGPDGKEMKDTVVCQGADKAEGDNIEMEDGVPAKKALPDKDETEVKDPVVCQRADIAEEENIELANEASANQAPLGQDETEDIDKGIVGAGKSNEDNIEKVGGALAEQALHDQDEIDVKDTVDAVDGKEGKGCHEECDQSILNKSAMSVNNFTRMINATYLHKDKKWILRCKVSHSSTECKWYKEVPEGKVLRRISLENDKRFIVRTDSNFRVLEVLDTSDISGLYRCELPNGVCCDFHLDPEETTTLVVKIGAPCEFTRLVDETSAKCEWFIGDTLIARDQRFTQYTKDEEFVLKIKQVQEDQEVSYRSKIGDEIQFYTLVISDATVGEEFSDGSTSPQGANNLRYPLVVQDAATKRGNLDVLHVVRDQADIIKILLDKIFNKDDLSKYKKNTSEIADILEDICANAREATDHSQWFKSLVRTTIEKCRGTIHGVKLTLMSIRYAFSIFCSKVDPHGKDKNSKMNNKRLLGILHANLPNCMDKINNSLAKIIATTKYLRDRRRSLEDIDSKDGDSKDKCKTLLDKTISSMGLLQMQWQSSEQRLEELQSAIFCLQPFAKDVSEAHYQSVASTVDQIRTSVVEFYQNSGNFENFYTSVDKRLEDFLRQCFEITPENQGLENHIDNPAEYEAVASQGRMDIWSNEN